jgi:hypothetical protein
MLKWMMKNVELCKKSGMLNQVFLNVEFKWLI